MHASTGRAIFCRWRYGPVAGSPRRDGTTRCKPVASDYAPLSRVPTELPSAAACSARWLSRIRV